MLQESEFFFEISRHKKINIKCSNTYSNHFAKNKINPFIFYLPVSNARITNKPEQYFEVVNIRVFLNFIELFIISTTTVISKITTYDLNKTY